MKKLFVFLLFPLLCFSQSSLEEAETVLKQKDYIKASNLLQEFLLGNPKNLKAIEFYGDAFAYQEKWDQAIAQYKKLVSAKPKEANYHYKYGGALAMKALQVNKLKARWLLG